MEVGIWVILVTKAFFKVVKVDILDYPANLSGLNTQNCIML